MSDQTEQLPEKPADGDGIKVTFEPQGNGTTVATIRDALRNCTVSRRIFTRYVERNPDLVRRYLNLKLIEALNKIPFQVGCFHNGKHGAGSSPDSMPQRDAPLSPPTEDPTSDPTVRNLVESLFDPPSTQAPLIPWHGERTPQR